MAGTGASHIHCCVGLQSDTLHPTNFGAEWLVTINNHDWVEYYQIGTSACLTDSGAVVYLQTWSKGDARQLWRWTGNTYTYGEVINDYATNHYGHNDCMTGNLSINSGAIVAAYDSSSDQSWADSQP